MIFQETPPHKLGFTTKAKVTGDGLISAGQQVRESRAVKSCASGALDASALEGRRNFPKGRESMESERKCARCGRSCCGPKTREGKPPDRRSPRRQARGFSRVDRALPAKCLSDRIRNFASRGGCGRGGAGSVPEGVPRVARLSP